MTPVRGTPPRVEESLTDAARLQDLGEQHGAVRLTQAHRQLAAAAVDLDLAEELVAAGGETLDTVGALRKTRSGPKVPSSRVAGKAPALSGPETNSQNGSKSSKAARSGR